MWKRRRREKLKSAAFPADWLRLLEERCPFYQRLPITDRHELQGHIQVFLAEKNFEGCGGLQLTNEIRICIAAQACLLLLHRKMDYFPELHSILVYPSAYFVNEIRHIGGGVMEERRHQRLGEAWPNGTVVLAWDAVYNGAADPADGYNIVLHEFAHQLDYEDGAVNGAPALGAEKSWSSQKLRYEAWERVLSAEFARHRFASERGKPAVLDAYGAENPAEFFAVATEAFFERPLEMREKHPELFAELKQYYQQDPATWGGMTKAHG